MRSRTEQKVIMVSSHLSFFYFFFFFATAFQSSESNQNPRPVFFPGSQKPSLFQAKGPKSHKLQFRTCFFPQKLDHFTFLPQGSKIFHQKYLINTDFWNKNPNHSAPIFAYTGNEGDIEWFADNTGFVHEIAPQFHALVVFIEHRFYGESKPFGEESYKSAKTLGYLNSQQALADFAVLITSLKKNLSAEASPVVVFGGSYGGMLAAWFRLKYPHVAIGALSSSAPILQFDGMTPSTSFYDAVSKDFKDASLSCFHVIRGSWDELDALSYEKKTLISISKNFQSCKKLKSIYSVRDWLWSAFVYTAMVDYPVAANFMMPLPSNPVDKMCKTIDGFPRNASNLTKAFAAAKIYYNFTGAEKCFNIEDDSDPHGLSGWQWQACTEMIMPMSCSNESMFPPSNYDYKEHERYCMKEYGVQPQPHWITTEFGGHKIQHVLKRFGSNIIFSNGMKDPWSRGGVLKSISSSIVALVTKEGAHHVDLRFSTKKDPDWLKEQRSKEVEIIRRWIKEYYLDLNISM